MKKYLTDISKLKLSLSRINYKLFFALLVLGLAGAFAHQQDLRVLIANAEDDVGAGLDQGAGPALHTFTC